MWRQAQQTLPRGRDEDLYHRRAWTLSRTHQETSAGSAPTSASARMAGDAARAHDHGGPEALRDHNEFKPECDIRDIRHTTSEKRGPAQLRGPASCFRTCHMIHRLSRRIPIHWHGPVFGSRSDYSSANDSRNLASCSGDRFVVMISNCWPLTISAIRSTTPPLVIRNSADVPGVT